MKRVLSVLVSLLAVTSVAQANIDIVGGSGPAAGSVVAQSTVAIYFQNNILCTSTIIGADIVMTAAHCVVDEQGQAGVVIFSQSLDDKNPTVLPIEGIVMPDDYVADTTNPNRNDIAIIKFDGALPAGFQPANLPSADLPLADGDALTVAGYGKSNPTDDNSAGTLLQTTTKVLSTEISDTEFETETKGQGVCSGDSGGPAYMQSGGKTYVVGVTNLADQNCTGFGVFLRVSPYLGWIQSAITTLHQPQPQTQQPAPQPQQQ